MKSQMHFNRNYVAVQLINLINEMVTALCQNYRLNPAALTAAKACSKLITPFFYQIYYMGPLIFAIISVSPSALCIQPSSQF